MKLFTFHSLQSKITVTFLVFIVTQLSLFSVVTFWFDSRSIYNEVANANVLTVEQMTNVLDTQIVTMDNVSAMLAEDPLVQVTMLEVREQVGLFYNPITEFVPNDPVYRLMESTRNNWPQIDNVYLYDLNGRKIGVTDYEVALANPEISNFKESDTQIVYGTVLNRTENKEFAVFSFLRLVKDNNGKPIGWIRMDQNLYNTDFFQKLSADERIFMVLEPSARVIYANHPEKVDIVIISSLLREQDRKGYVFQPYLDKDSLISYNTSSVTNWMTVLTVPQQLLNQGLIQVRTFAISFIFVNVLFAAFGAVLISRRVTQPLRQVFQSMKKIESGNFQTQIPVVSKDEIGELARRMNKMVENIDMLIKRVYKADIKNQEARFTALRAQINPHFLYNTLESMDALALNEETWKLHQMIESLAIMLRYALNAKESVLLRDELRHLEAYLNIQQIKYEQRLRIKLRIPEEDHAIKMPQLILQPIVENAFKYGLFHKKGADVLYIYTERGETALNIHIVDNGVGTEVDQLKWIMNPLDENNQLLTDKIGLYNVHQRIRLFYGDQYGIEVQSKPGFWFKVTVVIPLQGQEQGEGKGSDA